ncbi:hypothetical protein H696_04811 [Fonticula alba]|uniref:Rubicon Homology domain-containing protein n=1 Tax=Fonticula alba TaxID=691883 RepID=A0A058Z2M6_FONAL|nr:hypothetical protein H696_04811 [Fonticula alba]KCV68519.1 hypothetical protein H696_04811 [Fonticula alba]|eukprot:XP_009496951.1 hypothetical protein H696_04811 [Fonticula alba]
MTHAAQITHMQELVHAWHPGFVTRAEEELVPAALRIHLNTIQSPGQGAGSPATSPTALLARLLGKFSPDYILSVIRSEFFRDRMFETLWTMQALNESALSFYIGRLSEIASENRLLSSVSFGPGSPLQSSSGCVVQLREAVGALPEVAIPLEQCIATEAALPVLLVAQILGATDFLMEITDNLGAGAGAASAPGEAFLLAPTAAPAAATSRSRAATVTEGGPPIPAELAPAASEPGPSPAEESLLAKELSSLPSSLGLDLLFDAPSKGGASSGARAPGRHSATSVLSLDPTADSVAEIPVPVRRKKKKKSRDEASPRQPSARASRRSSITSSEPSGSSGGLDTPYIATPPSAPEDAVSAALTPAPIINIDTGSMDGPVRVSKKATTARVDGDVAAAAVAIPRQRTKSRTKAPPAPPELPDSPVLVTADPPTAPVASQCPADEPASPVGSGSSSNSGGGGGGGKDAGMPVGPHDSFTEISDFSTPDCSLPSSPGLPATEVGAAGSDSGPGPGPAVLPVPVVEVTDWQAGHPAAGRDKKPPSKDASRGGKTTRIKSTSRRGSVSGPPPADVQPECGAATRASESAGLLSPEGGDLLAVDMPPVVRVGSGFVDPPDPFSRLSVAAPRDSTLSFPDALDLSSPELLDAEYLAEGQAASARSSSSGSSNRASSVTTAAVLLSWADTRKGEEPASGPGPTEAEAPASDWDILAPDTFATKHFITMPEYIHHQVADPFLREFQFSEPFMALFFDDGLVREEVRYLPLLYSDAPIFALDQVAGRSPEDFAILLQSEPSVIRRQAPINSPDSGLLLSTLKSAVWLGSRTSELVANATSLPWHPGKYMARQIGQFYEQSPFQDRTSPTTLISDFHKLVTHLNEAYMRDTVVTDLTPDGTLRTYKHIGSGISAPAPQKEEPLMACFFCSHPISTNPPLESTLRTAFARKLVSSANRLRDTLLQADADGADGAIQPAFAPVKAHYCHFSEKWICGGCLSPSSFPIPARVVNRHDVTPQTVSLIAAAVLAFGWHLPVLALTGDSADAAPAAGDRRPSRVDQALLLTRRLMASVQRTMNGIMLNRQCVFGPVQQVIGKRVQAPMPVFRRAMDDVDGGPLAGGHPADMEPEADGPAFGQLVDPARLPEAARPGTGQGAVFAAAAGPRYLLSLAEFVYIIRDQAPPPALVAHVNQVAQHVRSCSTCTERQGSFCLKPGCPWPRGILFHFDATDLVTVCPRCRSCYHARCIGPSALESCVICARRRKAATSVAAPPSSPGGSA